MAARMACKISIGSLYQDVYIENSKYDGKMTKEVHQIPITQLSDFIVDAHDVEDIYLAGPIVYLMKIQQEVKSKELKKYNKNSKKIHFV